MKKFIVILLSSFIILAGCSKKDSSPDHETPELLEVFIKTPDQVKVNEEITVEAVVSQGDKKVTKAEEVKFEIWKSGQDEHEMSKANNEKNGTYSIKKTFTEPGTYFIVSHVTANSMHSMPKKEIIVEGPEGEKAEDSSGGHKEEASHSEHGEHQSSEVDFEFHSPSNLKINQPAQLMVHLKQNSEIVTGAAVRFEIWSKDGSNHTFLDASEGAEGSYAISFPFPSAGMYNVKIHVEKGNIHDHTEKTVEVGE